MLDPSQGRGGPRVGKRPLERLRAGREALQRLQNLPGSRRGGTLLPA